MNKKKNEIKSFQEFNLDDRLISSCERLNFEKPTKIQKKVIPIGLEGKDILIQAPTGSGKTASYLLPIINQILTYQKRNENFQTSKIKENIFHPFSVILVPTRELCEQVNKQIAELSYYCRKVLSSLHLAADVSLETQRIRLIAQKPDIIISTPNRLVAHLKANIIDLKNSLKILVIDEADLVLSFGYSEDIRFIVDNIPNICQNFLVSATLTQDVETLKQLLLHDPIICSVNETNIKSFMNQLGIKCEEKDKYLLIYVLIRLNQIQRKALIFTNSIDHSFKLKLFLERFSISSVVLNPELPQNSRTNILENFNKGSFEILIANDTEISNKKIEAINIDEEIKNEIKNENENENENENSLSKIDTIYENYLNLENQNQKSKLNIDSEFGVSRGIDFKNVKTVINFDFPLNIKDYIHRIGRTARAGQRGTAISFITSKNESLFFQIKNFSNQKFNKNNHQIFLIWFLSSRKIALKHDLHLQPQHIKPHLKNVPDYLLTGSEKEKSKINSQNFHKNKRIRNLIFQKEITKRLEKDPLKTF
ncbi:atp-dependent RNA helicase ddx56-related [Anaeramoeba ignava]|uniref:RNA helicase n=1 Tax=Anaeramoeba ignava TaxID=1746090 RepID=A0A9Q0LSW7_ANAIG|nr:atp-dependent RNA helicase ddx56-related [Anaeramoeba ignava]